MARTKGARGIGEAERRIIRIALVANTPISTIAEALGRSRQAVWQQVKVMKARGDFAQHVLPLAGDMGAGDDREA